MPLCQHCNSIDMLKLLSFNNNNDAKDSPHHNSFQDLKTSAETCQLCDLITKDLEKLPDWQYEEKVVTFTGYHDRKEDGSDFLVELAIECGGNFANLDIFADEG